MRQTEKKGGEKRKQLTTSASVPFLHSLEPEETFLFSPSVNAVFPLSLSLSLFDYTQRETHQNKEEQWWFVCLSARIKVVSCDCMISTHSAFACNCVFRVWVSVWEPAALSQTYRQRARGVERLSGLHSQIIGWQTVIRCKFLTSESAGASPPYDPPNPPPPPPPPSRGRGWCR